MKEKKYAVKLAFIKSLLIMCSYFLSAGIWNPDGLKRLGEVLPSAIMAVLIVYCLKDAGSDVNCSIYDTNKYSVGNKKERIRLEK